MILMAGLFGTIIFVVGIFYLINCAIEDDPVFPHLHNYRVSKKTIYGDTPVRLSFAQFQKFYATAPTRWHQTNTRWYYDAPHSKDIHITATNFIDYFRMLSWWKRQERSAQKNKTKIEEMREMTRLLEFVKADAKMAEQEAEKMMRQQEQEINDILNRLGVKVAGGH